jgi:hypothetical protein
MVWDPGAEQLILFVIYRDAILDSISYIFLSLKQKMLELDIIVFYIFFFIFFKELFLRWAGPRPHIQFPPLVQPDTSHLAPSITVLVFPDSANAYSRTTASYRLTQRFRRNTRE